MTKISLNSKRCLVIGEGSIARFCLELLEKNGFDIQACVTGDPQVTQWLQTQNTPGINWRGEAGLIDTLRGFNYDLLISVGNRYQLETPVLEHCQAIAMNIHDGPLHECLGFNTPAWALLNGHTSHEVCWHLMTPALYQGDILHRTPITIDTDETAMTLNAKCFNAALVSLELVLEQLQHQGITPIVSPHTALTKANYFSLTTRPDHAGFLDPHQPKATAIHQVQALDHGHLANPLCLAKIKLGTQVYHVTGAQSIQETVQNPAQTTVGQVFAIQQLTEQLTEPSIDVYWSDGQLRLELAALEILQPELVLAEELLGQSIEHFHDTKQPLALLSQHFGRWEQWWLLALGQFSPLNIPYIGSQDTMNQQRQSIALETRLSFDHLLCALAAYLARLCDQPSLSIPVIFDHKYANPTEQLSQLADTLGAPKASLHCPLDFERPLQEQVATVMQAWQELLCAGIFSRDLVKRHPHLTQWQASVDQAYCLLISDEDDHSLSTRLSCFSGYALIFVISPQRHCIRAVSYGGLIKPLTAILAEIHFFADQLFATPQATTALGMINLITPQEQAQLKQWSHGPTITVQALLVERLETVFTHHPNQVAIYHRDDSLTFAALASQIQQVRHALQVAQVKHGEFVGVMMPRCIQLLPCLLGVMSFGAACVPMDPSYPADRLEYMIKDSGLAIILCLEQHQTLTSTATQLCWSELGAHGTHQSTTQPISQPHIQAADIAYMLYTSGSSGQPKGVVVEHENLANFFVAMDEQVPLKQEPNTQEPVWLAVTSISFDISLLELLWTLTRAVSVVLYDGQDMQNPSETNTAGTITKDDTKKEYNPTKKTANKLDFGLFFWNISSENDQPGAHQYELLLQAAEYGDQHGFNAIWTPERHFGDFGGLYPNPAIICAAVAARTQHIHIRAGSCVLPLHHPIRITEDWSMIDNISNGRVGLSAAPGWMPDDFVIMPQNHANAKEKMFENLALVQKLWRADPVTLEGPTGPVNIITRPRPVQKELPVWITTGGNPENFQRAGAMGAHLLTHLLGQTIEELEEKIILYRQARAEAGFTGPGCITVMLHTFVADTTEQARAITLEPMKNYLKTALFLVKAAAWDWPLFKKLSQDQSQNLDEFFKTISEEDLDALLEFAFDRYFKTSGLFGDHNACVAFAHKLYAIGVNEIGCLIDYGIDTQTVLDHLPNLKAVLQDVNGQTQPSNHADSAPAPYGVAALIARHQVTHLQFTPSMARLFLSDPDITTAMQQLKTILVGGEALPLDLAHTLKNMIDGPLLNMYGPTETTIWSSVSCMHEPPTAISLGQAVANTQLSIVDRRRQPLPIGAIGELMIGGQGVVRGYWQKPDLTADKFLTNSPQLTSAATVYATGDLARYMPDSRLLFLGRNDFQVKVRGYRIELEEIETVLLQQPGIAQAIVQPVVYSGAEPRLVGYYTLAPNHHALIDAKALKKAMHAVLPPFMVPNTFVQLNVFPLTPNAKIDRKALPRPASPQAQKAAIVAPKSASAIEQQVLDIWQDILGSETFGLDDNFFDHGGHSLLVVDVMTRVQPLFTKKIKLIDLFRFPKVRELVSHLADETGTTATVVSSAQSRAAARRAARKRS